MDDDFKEASKAISSIKVSHQDLFPIDKYLPHVSIEITNRIAVYNTIKKTCYNLLGKRAFELFIICRLCQQESKALVSKPISKKYVDDIFKIAAGKHNYIVVLIEKLAPFFKKNPFVSFLHTYFQPYSKGNMSSKYMVSITKYNEAIDPYRRGHKDDYGDVSVNFQIWKIISQRDPKTPHFLLWLEGQRSRESSLLEGTILSFKPKNYTEFSRQYLLNGWFDFIMLFDGSFRISPHGNCSKHIGLTEGKPVACAGEMHIRNGKILGINNSSGHFRPKSKHLRAAANELKKHNCFNFGKLNEDIGYSHSFYYYDAVSLPVLQFLPGNYSEAVNGRSINGKFELFVTEDNCFYVFLIENMINIESIIGKELTFAGRIIIEDSRIKNITTEGRYSSAFGKGDLWEVASCLRRYGCFSFKKIISSYIGVDALRKWYYCE